MIPKKVKEHLDEYIYQEVYVQIALIKGKEKGTTKSAINQYFTTNHFKDLIAGKPYDHFINNLRDKCLIKLLNSPMRNKETNDEVIKELQKKLNDINNEDLENTFWEIETGEYLDINQIKELEIERDHMIKKLNFKNYPQKDDKSYRAILDLCKKYEELCVIRYPDAPLPLKILQT
jgi:hypothetical protein